MNTSQILENAWSALCIDFIGKKGLKFFLTEIALWNDGEGFWVCGGLSNSTGRPTKIIKIQLPSYSINPRYESATGKQVKLENIHGACMCLAEELAEILEANGIPCQIPVELRKILDGKIAIAQRAWNADVEVMLGDEASFVALN